MKYLFTCFFSFFFFTSSYAQTVVYVTQSGSGNQSGGSWSDALPGTQLQARLASAGAGTQFWIASGTYKPTTGTDRTISFAIPSGVQLYGGFAGSESRLEQRAPGQQETVFSGDIGGISEPSDNSQHVLTINNASQKIILDRLTVRDGRIIPYDYASLGAGLWVVALDRSSELTISDCRFINNKIAGSLSGGGAIGLDIRSGSGSNLVVKSCYFTENEGGFGGAFSTSTGSSNLTVIFDDCTFINNNGGNESGAISTTDATSNCSFLIRRCRFLRNTAFYTGGAIVLGTGRHEVDNCLFENNTTKYQYGTGGAVSYRSSLHTFRNCVFASNSSANGGAVYSSSSSGRIQSSFINCSFVRNSASVAGGVFNAIVSDGRRPENPNETFLTNCIAWQNTAPDSPVFKSQVYIDALTSQLIATYSNIQGGFAGTGNINTDPLFVDATNGDYRLLAVSPSVDTGDSESNASNVPITDLDGAPRIVSNRIDMGAYEFKARFGSGSTVYVTPTGSGDGSGSSWANALSGTALRPALYEAAPGTTLWLSSGMYKPLSQTNSRNYSFFIAPNVKLYGGFAGNETTLTDRSLSQPSSTTLSGDIGLPNDNSDNSYHVVLFRNASNEARLDGVVVTGGNASDSGGGIYCNGSGATNSSSPTIANCLVTKNAARYNGGGQANNGDYGNSSPQMFNCLYENNTAAYGGGISSSGLPGSSSPSFSRCIFTNNSASSQGGGLYSFGYFAESKDNIRLTNCTIRGNTAPNGAGLYAGNSVGASLTLSLVNCLFDHNRATDKGGGIFISTYSSIMSATTVNSTFDDNSANTGGNIFSSTTANSTGIDHRIVNSLLRNGNIAYSTDNNTTPPTNTITYSNIQGGFAGTGNIDADPQFVDAANGDYRLKAGSPAINTGDPGSTTATVSDKDLAGSPRIAQDRIDMGAYEFQVTSQNNADLSLKLRVNSRTSNLNQPVTYQLTITNDGPITATNVVWQNRLPDNLVYVGGSNLSLSNGILSGQLASLAVGASATFTYQLQASLPGQYRNAAQIIATDQPDPDSQPNSGTGDGQDDMAMDDFRAAGGSAVYASANPNQTPLPNAQSNQPAPDPAKADLSLAMYVSNRTPKVGEVITVSITVSNAGGLPANGVMAQLFLPTGIAFVSGSEISPFGSLGLNASVTRTLQVRVTGQGSLTLRAELSASDQPDPDSRPNSGADGEDDTATVDLRVQSTL